MHHASSGSRSCLIDKKGSGAATCIMALDPLGGLRCAVYPTTLDPASLRGGLRAATRPTIPCGRQVSNIKKSLVGLSMQPDSHVPNAHAHVCKASDVRALMGL
jgi:hypothetical protein